MTNVEITRTATVLTITIDLTEQGKRSASGKSMVIASTEGNKRIPGHEADKDKEIFLGLNLYYKG